MTMATAPALALATALCVAGAFAPAAAQDAAPANADRVQEAFGNTIRSTYPDGRTAELWLAQDGSYTAQGRRHDPSSGHWTMKADKLCLKQSRPIPAPFSYCVDLPASLSASWTGKAYTGEPIQIALVRGRVGG